MAPRPVEVPIVGKDRTKPAFDSAVKNAESFRDKLKASLLNPLNVVQGAVIASVATIGSALLRSVAGFVKGSVESAAAAEAAWGRVESAVRSAGINFDNVKGSLDRVFTALQKTTRFSDDDAADAFATLVRISGDYDGSLKNLALTADIAAAKKMDLAAAAETVGKVMAGEEGSLKRFGVIVRENETAMEAMRRQFNGFAERDGKTMEGQLRSVANSWDNVKEAVGRTISEIGRAADDSSGFSKLMIDSLNGIASWIDNHKRDFSEFFGILTKGFSAAVEIGAGMMTPGGLGAAAANIIGAPKAGGSAMKVEFQSVQQWASEEQAGRREADRIREQQALEKRVEKMKEEYELLQLTAKIRTLNKQEQREMLSIESQMAHLALLNGNKTAIQFVAGMKDDDRRMAALAGGDLALPGLATHTKKPPALEVRLPKVTPGTPGAATRGFGDDAAFAFTQAMGGDKAFAGVETSLGSLDSRLKDFTGNTLANFFQVWQDGIGDVIHEHNVLGRVLPALMRKAAGGALAADAQDTMWRAAKAAALALTDPSGIHALQAFRLFGIASGELAAAAALQGGGGGYGGGAGGVSSGGFSQVQSDIGGRGKVIIPLPRGKNAYTADELSALADAIKELDSTRDIEFVYE